VATLISMEVRFPDDLRPASGTDQPRQRGEARSFRDASILNIDPWAPGSCRSAVFSALGNVNVASEPPGWPSPSEFTARGFDPIHSGKSTCDTGHGCTRAPRSTAGTRQRLKIDNGRGDVGA